MNEGRYLRMMHKGLAGRRHSDHTALLVAFYQWLKAKWHGEDAEREFCERRALNMQIMRMTYEARNQLKDIMILSGFPEECLLEQLSYDVNNADPKLDLINSLLAYALYPNVCFHTDKRKLFTADGKQALIHKNSVNCGREITSFPSPFFIFGEKIKTRAVSAKQMSMVTPVQLLMFASEKVETMPSKPGLICIDNWIYLKIESRLAALILLLRTALDRFLVDCLSDANQILTSPRHISLFGEALTLLSDLNNYHVTFRKVDELIQDAINTTSTNFNSQVYSKYSGDESTTAQFHLEANSYDFKMESTAATSNELEQPQAKRYERDSSFRINEAVNTSARFGGSGYRGGGASSFRGNGNGGSGCFKCGQVGHFSRECPKQQSAFPRFGAGGSGGRGGFNHQNMRGGSTAGGFARGGNASGFSFGNAHASFTNSSRAQNAFGSNENGSKIPVPPHLMCSAPFVSASSGFANAGSGFGANRGGSSFSRNIGGGFGVSSRGARRGSGRGGFG